MRIPVAIVAGLVQAQGPLKVMVHMSLGTNSHIRPLLEIATILVQRNHSVFYASFESNKKYNEPYQLPFVSLGNDADAAWDPRLLKSQFSKREHFEPIEQIVKTFGTIAPEVYDKTYPVILQVMKTERPDVVICDFIATACRDAAQMLKIPLITGFQSTDMYGITDAPFLTSNMKYGSITTKALSFFQRLQTKVVAPLVEKYQYRSMIKGLNAVRAKHDVPPTTTPFGDFSTSLGLASSFFGFEAAFPFPPHIKMIGPIKSNSYPPLTPELAMFLENHDKTMYIAFGSGVILAEFDIENLVISCLEALADGSINGVLWGLGKTILEDFPEIFTFNGKEITRGDLFSGQVPHLHLLSWAPQIAILEHANTRLFISHGGLESSFEAIMSGTPILCMPFHGDQPRNARKLEDAGIAKYIDRITATPTTILQAVRFMNDAAGSVSADVKRMQTIAQLGSRRKEYGADEVEEYGYIARSCRPLQPHVYGEIPCELKHLAMSSRDMSYAEANLIDVYAFLTIFALGAGAGLYYGIKTLSQLLISKPDRDFVKKNK